MLTGIEGCRRLDLAAAALASFPVPGFRVEPLTAVSASCRPALSGFDLLHVWAPGLSGTAALRTASACGIPSVTGYHPGTAAGYDLARIVLSPAPDADHALEALGVSPTALRRWRPGVDRGRFTPAAFDPAVLPVPQAGDRLSLLYVGRLTPENEVGLLAEAVRAARRQDPRLHLFVVGSGPEQPELHRRLGPGATFLGSLDPVRLAAVYAGADLFVWPCRQDPFAQPVLEAQASGLPVLAVAGGGACELIESGRSGCLVPPNADALAEALVGLARRATLRERLSVGALIGIRTRTCERAATSLAAVWSEVLVGERRSVPPAAQAA